MRSASTAAGVPFAEVRGDRAQRVEQLAVGGAGAGAEHGGEVDGDVDRGPGAERARNRGGVAVVFVVGSLL